MTERLIWMTIESECKLVNAIDREGCPDALEVGSAGKLQYTSVVDIKQHDADDGVATNVTEYLSWKGASKTSQLVTRGMLGPATGAVDVHVYSIRMP
jgi:hypothetical protein